MRKNGFAVVVCLHIIAAPASGDDNLRRFEISPLFGFVAGGEFEDKLSGQTLKLNDSNAIGLQFNIRADSQSTWEFDYARQDTTTNFAGLPGIDITIDYLQFGGTYEISQASMRPFAAATVGVARFTPATTAIDDETFFAFSLGGGIRFLTEKSFGFTLDARWVASVINEDTDIFCLSANGLTCLVQTDAGLASQFRVFLGFNARF